MPVVICNRRSRIDGHSINLSEGGIYVFAAANFSVGTQIEIEFRPPGSNELLRIRGTIRRRALYLYGIEFLSDHVAASGDLTGVQTENPISSRSAVLKARPISEANYR